MSFSLFAPTNGSTASINGPAGLAFDASGYLYCSNYDESSIVKISKDGMVSSFYSDSSLRGPSGLIFDASGLLYCAWLKSGKITILSNSGEQLTSFDTSLNKPRDLAFDASGYLYCSNEITNDIVKFSSFGLTVTTFSSDASLNYPYGLAFDFSGNLYCANFKGDSILKFNPDGTNVTSFYSGGLLDKPTGLAFDKQGNLYCANSGWPSGRPSSIIKISPDGSSASTFSSDVSLNFANYLAFDTSEYLYCSNYLSNNILKSDAASCFNKGTKILCLNKLLQEEYIPIEDLKKGDLVKTYLHGYRRIHLIGKGFFSNKPKIWHDSMYKMVKTDLNEGFEDLIVTGGHGILVNNITDEDKENYKKLGFYNEMEKIDDKYLLTVAISHQFTQITTHDFYTYYHFVPENDGDNNRRFGVWANGILTETPSKTQFLKHKYEIL